MPWAEHPDKAETLDHALRARKRLAGNDGFETVIVEGDRIIGAIGYHGVDWRHRNTSIGYWLAEGHQGRGIMTAAVRALVEHAFDGWKLHRVEISAAPDNVRSRAIAERLGFREEGVLREAERFAGRYADLVVYGLLAPEWAERAHLPSS